MIYNLQTARAIAALIVGFQHMAIPGLSVGYFGVDIFFVISGYIMTMLCFRNPKNFFSRRFVRVVPFYWLLTLATYLISYRHPEWMNSTKPVFTNFLKSIFFIPYIKENGTMHPMLEVGWTLNYEMYFYSVIGVILLFVRPQIATLVAIVFMFIVQGFCALFATTTATPLGVLATFYSSVVIENFMMGVLIYYGTQKIPNFRIHPAVLLTCAPCCIIYLGLHQLYRVGPPLSYHPMASFISADVPSALFILCFVLLENQKFIFTKNTLLGDASYALYLTNQFVVSAYEKVLYKVLHIPVYSVIDCLLMMSTSVAVAIVVYKFIERPIHDALRRFV